jgi:hypothetical protein
MKRLNKNRKRVPVWIQAVAAATSIALECAVAGGAENSASALATPIEKTKTMNIQIKVCNERFTATFEDNATAKAFKAVLPMTIQMTELNGNEKYFRLSVDLPTNASSSQTIQTGDLMIYGQNTLVLFYKSFPTSYSYTRLGRINDTAGLAAALGSGEATVSYELQEKQKGNGL